MSSEPRTTEQTIVYGSPPYALRESFALLTPDERQLLTCALAGNHPDRLAPLRTSVLRGLAYADMSAKERQT